MWITFTTLFSFGNNTCLAMSYELVLMVFVPNINSFLLNLAKFRSGILEKKKKSTSD